MPHFSSLSLPQRLRLCYLSVAAAEESGKQSCVSGHLLLPGKGVWISFGVEDIRYFELLLKCYRDLNDTSKEIETQLRISERRSFYAKLNKKNGDEVYAIGKYEAARSYYKTALGYAENSRSVLNNMGCACCCLYQYDEAKGYLEKALKSDSSYYLAYFNLGNCCLCTGDTEEELRRAEEYFRKAQTLNPQFKRSEQMLGSMDRRNIRMIIDEDSSLS